MIFSKRNIGSRVNDLPMNTIARWELFIVNALLLMVGGLLAVPKAFYGYLLVGGVPLYNSLLFLFYIWLYIRALMVSGRQQKFAVVSIGLFAVCMFYVVVIRVFGPSGAMYTATSTFNDVACFAAAFSGPMLLSVFGLIRLEGLLIRLGVLYLGVFPLLELGLYLRWIPSESSSTRLFDPAAFFVVGVLFLTVPLIFGRLLYSGKEWLGSLLLVVFSLEVAFFVLISSTRSVLLILILVVGMCLMAKRHRVDSGARKGLVLSLILLLGGSLILMFDTERMTIVGRLSSMEIHSESRFNELLLFLDFMKGSSFLGYGLGSMFYSTVGAVQGWDGLAISPHIGSLTFWQKGGVPLFLLLYACPFLYVLKVLKKGTASICYFPAVSLFTFFVQSWLSGIWSHQYIFVVSACYGILLVKRGERTLLDVRV